jgi:hypothetical protein
MQAAVPPGTNDTEATQTVVPIGGVGIVPGQMPAAAATPAGTAIPNDSAPAGQQPPAPGGPIGADGRMPMIPPGVPLPGSPAERKQQAIGVPPSNRITPGPPAPAVTPAKPQARCDVILSVSRTELSSIGGEFTINAAMQPAFCATPGSLAVDWVRVVDAAALRFSADPNNTNSVRETVIAVGNASFFLIQEPPAQPGLAAAPSRLVFAIDKEGKTDKKRFAAWTEYGSRKFKVRGGHPWLSITPHKPKDDREVYEVTVARDAGLGAGTHDSFVELVPEGAAASLRIPVVVEVVGRP